MAVVITYFAVSLPSFGIIAAPFIVSSVTATDGRDGETV